MGIYCLEGGGRGYVHQILEQFVPEEYFLVSNICGHYDNDQLEIDNKVINK
jgi:hypothetical protein